MRALARQFANLLLSLWLYELLCFHNVRLKKHARRLKFKVLSGGAVT